MGAPKTHKSTKSASSQASTSSRKREQDQEVAAEPSPSVAATYGSSSAGDSDVTLGRSEYGDDRSSIPYDAALAQAKVQDTKQFVCQAAKAQEIRAGYGKDPEEAEARHKQEIEQFLRGSDPAKGDEDKADDKPSSSR